MARASQSTPAALGFRMPAEWEPQAAVWLSWPHKHSTWPGHFRPIPAKFAEIAATVSRFETVRLNVARPLQARVRDLLRRCVNKDAAKGADLSTLEALLNPQLKGKIIVRDASQPNAGAFSLAPLYKQKGGEFLTKFLREMDVKVLDNPQQLDTTLMRGGAALAFGMQGQSFAQCVKDGGCKNMASIPTMATAVSRGLSIFKNAPHPEATKVFVNWLLSKKGQELMVSEWAKYNLTGAVSMRKDVEPHPEHRDSQPDFGNPKQYVWVSTDEGSEEIDAVVKIFKEVTGK